ncbi:MAG: helix-turn-helix domain-containing protein [Firmicutes bacterium]|nr:helix-turn-helix domain-containing protein [Bacillota bacterium]
MSEPREIPSHEGLGSHLRQVREAKGLTLETLARELQMPPHLLAAIESDDWDRVPPGRERPLARQVARRLNVDPEALPEAWERVPGAVAQEAPPRGQEKLERILMGAMVIGSAALLLWLVVPGKEIKQAPKGPAMRANPRPATPWVPVATKPSNFPVLGEMLPEAPITEEGILVNLRAMDSCVAVIHNDQGDLRHELRISEPWTLRVKGPFSLDLDNAGVVTAEIAGRRVLLSGIVGEPWSGRFDAQGQRILPPRPVLEEPLQAPDTDLDPPKE